jgi:8-oxo-dGTP diphosphatase
MPSTVADPIIHVAAGVIADRDRFFITRRLPSTHQAGKWEFPGGKIHEGESVAAALRRELHEELGIVVADALPFMQVRHAYPDKSVLLDVLWVTSYTGVPHGYEGQEMRWVSRRELLTLDFPEADLPIQRRLWLPMLYAISDCARDGREIFMPRLERALAGGLRLLQLREPTMDETVYLGLAQAVVALCHRHGAKVLLNADPALIGACDADGVHLNSKRLMQARSRPAAPSQFVAASCHDERELLHAANIGCDLVVLGPVKSTGSHPATSLLGWEQFAQLARGVKPAVYALGGMRLQDLSRARASGAQGLAMISGLWKAADMAAVVDACADV